MSERVYTVIIWILGFMVFAVLLHLVLVKSPYPGWWPEEEESIVPGYPYFNEWVRFEDRIAGFGVQLPIWPNRSTEQMPIDAIGNRVKRRDYVSSDPWERQFVIMVTEYPPSVDLSDPMTAMRSTLDTTLTGNFANQRQQVTEGTYNNSPMLEYRFEGSGQISSGMLVLSGQRLYFLLYLDTPENRIDGIHAAFTRSFSLL